MRYLMNQRTRRAAFFSVWLLAGCSGDTTEQVINNNIAPTEEKSLIPTNALVISGTLANGEDASNSAVLSGQEVAIIRNDGVIVAQGTTDVRGAFEVTAAAGALIIDSSFSKATTSLADEANKATTEDFSYTLQAKVPDDGAGRALGIRRKIDISDTSVSKEGTLNIGQNELKEVTAIIGTLGFADANISLSGADVFIPGKPFFVRTGDDGNFSLLFVPAGTYKIRITKGFYIKDVTVNVTAGKTSDLSTVTVTSSERNPLSLASVLPGTWQSKCSYNDIAAGVNPENPRTGTITLTALDTISVTGQSCILRTMTAGVSFNDFLKLIVFGDGALVAKFTGIYFSTLITSYTNDQIVMDVDNSSLASGKVIEVWTRVN